jgi:hypothetical protein
VPKKDALAEVFSTRLRPAESKEVWGAIERSGERKSEWIRLALLKAARVR